MTEEWKDIPGYEDRYMISDMGCIFSKYRKRVLTPKKSGGGYLAITLAKNGKKKRYYIHRLVAEIFLPSANGKRAEVNHIDLDKTNNCVTNLEWVSKRDNMKHAYFNGRTDFRRPIRKDNITGIKGVSKQGNGFQVSICLNGKSIYLGWYSSLNEARNVRKVAEKVALAYAV